MKTEEIWICVRFRDNDFSSTMQIAGNLFSDACNELYEGLFSSSFAGAQEFFLKRLNRVLDPKNIVEALKRYYVSAAICPDVFCEDHSLNDALSKVKSDIEYLNFEESVKVFRVKADFDEYMKQHAGTFDQDFLLISSTLNTMTAEIF